MHRPDSRAALLIAIVSIALGCTGCATAGRHVRWYDGPSRNPTEMSVLKVQSEFLQPSAIVYSIDGTSIQKENKGLMGNTKDVEFVPGTHTLEVGYFDGS